ncbi:hypothetical protein [Pseudalkalibacillus decolorationis]|uniref:hypothetical protein n=1 Tax=Pseudalkalibacillus decolorationis TaxID=163879 RepID=UPI00214876D8|nr:hypothetical protein [Pseudalkalibacillus decolorationis]
MSSNVWTMIGILSIIGSFILVVFGFMRMVPLFIATPLLFLSIFFNIYRFNHRRSFKGFKSSQ